MSKKIEIIYEDSDVVVINKPSGLIVHSDGKTDESTLVDWILEGYPETALVGESFQTSTGVEIHRPGIVHRLDRETSGALVIAKNQKMFECLKQQFKDRKVVKVYNAFVYGEIKNDSNTIDRPIGKSKKDFRMWSAQRGARGTLREAVTEYSILKRHGGFSFVEVQPKTGRTHQIRVHFKAINYPVVCDKLYAPKHDCALGFQRLALHARSLFFKGVDGNEITAEAQLPDDFVEACEKMDD